MTSLELPAAIKSIGNESFSGCSGLNAIYSSVSPAPQIDTTSFSGLYDSAVVNIPESLLGDYTHRYTNWTLFKNLQTDHDGTNEIFESEGFAYEHVNDSDVRIVKSAAYESLTDLTVPATLTTAENDTVNCEQLNVVAIASGAFSGLEALERVAISEGISSVGPMAFKDCPALTAVTLPSTVADINASTFEGCSALASLPVGTNIAKIGSAAFAETKLTSVDLPEATAIDDYAFADIPTLKTLNTGDNLTSIGIGAFKGASLTEVTLSSTTDLEIGQNAFRDCSKLKTVSVGKNVVSIGAHAFDGTVVATLNLVKDGALRKIGNSAFSGIRARGTLDLPDALEEIGDSAFINPRMYSGIILPANRKLRIGDEAFAHAQRVTTITFPDAITMLGDGAFRDNAATELNIKSDNIGAEAFLMNNKLQTLSVAGSGIMDARAFAELPELVSANIDVAEIGE